MKNATLLSSELKNLDRSYASCKYKLDEATEEYRDSCSHLDEARYAFNKASRARAFNYMKFYAASILKLITGAK